MYHDEHQSALSQRYVYRKEGMMDIVKVRKWEEGKKKEQGTE